LKFNNLLSYIMPIFVAIVAVTIIVPLPWQLLDLLIAANISLSLVLLLMVSSAKPSEVTVFPTVLLLATLLRVSLNVASTRLVLSQGYAGQVIQRFGEFVAAGNPVLGLVMFLIITVVQFVVVTKGAERVAEVAARFTLDAMPGKQMSVDADLNAGLITDDEAKKRREEIRREADFYGAMDGASRFVRGDAIAGLLIVGINLIGGFVVGVVQQHLSASEAFYRYVLLTVGDGLSAQIPALMTSAAAGVIVTRAAAESDLGGSLAAQVAAQPKALLGAGFLLFALGIVPGMAHIPMIAVGAALIAAGWFAKNRVPEAKDEEEEDKSVFEDLYRFAVPDPLVVELGSAAVALADPDKPDSLPAKIGQLRQHIAAQWGIVIPPVRICDNPNLKANAYAVLVRGVEVARGEILPGHYLAIAAGETGEIQGVPARDPAFGLPALWITEERRSEAEISGWTVVDLVSVVITHLTEVLRKYSYEFLDRQEVQRMLDAVRRSHPALVDDLVPAVLGVAEVQEVLRNLARENVPLTDMVTILDTLGRSVKTTKDPRLLTAEVRRGLGRLITRTAGIERGAPVLVLEPSLERKLLESALKSPGTPAVEPSLAEAIISSLAEKVRQIALNTKETPVVVCPAEIRDFMKALTERVSSRIPVLAYTEVTSELKPVGVISVVQ